MHEIILLLPVVLLACFICFIVSLVAINKANFCIKNIDLLLQKISQLEELVGLKVAPVMNSEPTIKEASVEEAVVTPMEQPAPPVFEEKIITVERKDYASIEERVGKKWAVWIGVVTLFIGIGFFVKYAFDNKWLGPLARVILGNIVGVSLLVAGGVFVKRQWQAFRQSLLGGGLAVLYLSLFASFSLYQLLPQKVAFAAMAGVTIVGMVLAISNNSVIVSCISVLGGLLTPIMLSTGIDARDILFTYLTILNIGIFGVAFFKDWKAIDVLAFVGTWVLFGGWYNKFYGYDAMAPTLLWIGVFYAIFLALPFVNNLRNRIPATPERFLMLIVNVTVAFIYAYKILEFEHMEATSVVALVISASCLVMAVLVHRLIKDDKFSFFGFVTLSVAFLTLSIPLYMKAHGIMLLWSIEAPILLYLGYRFQYLPLRMFGFLVALMTFGRLFLEYWPLHTALFDPVVNKQFASAMFVCLMGGASAFIHGAFQKASTDLDGSVKKLLGIVSAFVALIILTSESWRWFHDQIYVLSVLRRADLAIAYCVAIVIWAIGSFGFLAAGTKLRQHVYIVAGFMAMLVAMVFAVMSYVEVRWTDLMLFVNYRFVIEALLAASVFVYAYRVRAQVEKGDGERKLANFIYIVAGIFLLLILSVETRGWCISQFYVAHTWDLSTAKWISQMALSIVWGVYAIAALVIGFWKNIRPLRFCALGLFAITVFKLVVVDMSSIGQLYRIISFFALGLLMITTSFIYHRVEKRLQRKGAE